jgi:hypothetical protein
MEFIDRLSKFHAMIFMKIDKTSINFTGSVKFNQIDMFRRLLWNPTKEPLDSRYPARLCLSTRFGRDALTASTRLFSMVTLHIESPLPRQVAPALMHKEPGWTDPHTNTRLTPFSLVTVSNALRSFRSFAHIVGAPFPSHGFAPRCTSRRPTLV